MKSKKGFSLIELVIAMAILALIMGTLVNLFGSSIMGMHTGVSQEVAYEDARLTTNELKTTLRNADREMIQPKELSSATDTLTYKGQMFDRHMDIAQGENKDYEVTVSWQDNKRKQIKIIRKNLTDNRIIETIFPKDEQNSAFKGDGSDFPISSELITMNSGEKLIMYEINLPVRYMIKGEVKTDLLKTKVMPGKGEDQDTSIEAQMIKAYRRVLELGLKVKNTLNVPNSEKPPQGTLEINERAIYDDFMKSIVGEGVNNAFLLDNDKIRRYLNVATAPIVANRGAERRGTIEDTNTSVFASPVCHTKNPADIFLMGKSSANTSGWYSNFVYNIDKKQWQKGQGSTNLTGSWTDIKNKTNDWDKFIMKW